MRGNFRHIQHPPVTFFPYFLFFPLAVSLAELYKLAYFEGGKKFSQKENRNKSFVRRLSSLRNLHRVELLKLSRLRVINLFFLCRVYQM